MVRGNRRRILRVLVLVGTLFLGTFESSVAQTVAERIRTVENGSVRMSFAAKPGVCGDGASIRTIRRTDDWEGWCDSGPVRVALEIREREVVDVDTYLGGRWRPASDVVDLGIVPVTAAAEYMLSLAAELDGRVGGDAIVPAVLADSVVVWPQLLRIARDASRPRKTREHAVFWLSQAATERVTSELEEIVDDETTDLAVREHAVFALSQRPNDEAVPALIRIARSHPSVQVRGKALFWLGQSDDPRAVGLFEEILLRPD